MPERIPFDALILQGVLLEATRLVGAHIDKVRQLDDLTLIIHTRVGSLLISCDARAPRAYLATDRGSSPSGFASLVHDRMSGGRIDRIEQLGFDRRFVVAAKGCELVADLVGTRANLTLIGPQGALGRLRRVSPPSGDAPKTLGEALSSSQGLSKALSAELDLIGAEALLVKSQTSQPVYYSSVGAYPCPLEHISKPAVPMASLSQALEKHFNDLIPTLDAEALRQTLRGQISQALRARQKTLTQIDEVLDTAGRARKLQMFGELILAYSPTGVDKLVTADYEGNPVEIDLNPDKTPPENADRYFRKAKKAKKAAQDLIPKAERMRREIAEIEALADTVEDNPADAAARARTLGMLREQQLPPDKRVVAHEGHRVRETEVEGFPVFWGETATANDYVTTRIAKPNDYWLHVRGAHGSHVVVRTNNKPDKVPPEVLRRAAMIAAKHSNQKHAQHVPVTVTLAKHVRKPRKAAAGAVTFSHDKTLFVDPQAVT